MLAREGCADVAARGGGVQVDDALGLAQREDPIIGRGSATGTGDGLIRVVVVDHLNEAALISGERAVVEVRVHPRAQVGVFPRDLLEGHVVVLAHLEDVCAQEEELAVDAFKDDPLNRLGTIARIAILLVGAKLDDIALGCEAVRQRRIGLDEGSRALRGVTVPTQRVEDLVRALGIPGLV